VRGGGHFIVFLDLATKIGGSRTVTCTNAVRSGSSRTDKRWYSSLEMELTAIALTKSFSLSLGTQEQIAPHQETNQLGYICFTINSSIIGTPSVAPLDQKRPSQNILAKPDYRTVSTPTDRFQFIFRGTVLLLKGS